MFQTLPVPGSILPVPHLILPDVKDPSLLQIELSVILPDLGIIPDLPEILSDLRNHPDVIIPDPQLARVVPIP